MICGSMGGGMRASWGGNFFFFIRGFKTLIEIVFFMNIDDFICKPNLVMILATAWSNWYLCGKKRERLEKVKGMGKTMKCKKVGLIQKEATNSWREKNGGKITWSKAMEDVDKKVRKMQGKRKLEKKGFLRKEVNNSSRD